MPKANKTENGNARKPWSNAEEIYMLHLLLKQQKEAGGGPLQFKEVANSLNGRTEKSVSRHYQSIVEKAKQVSRFDIPWLVCMAPGNFIDKNAVLGIVALNLHDMSCTIPNMD